MFKYLLPLLIAISLAGGCGAPAKTGWDRQPVCSRVGSYGLSDVDGTPYAKEDKGACARAARPFDVAVWLEAPYNSHKVRGRGSIALGCKPISARADNCDACGLPGQSASAVLNFDPTVFPEDAMVRRVTLAVHSPESARKLAEAQLRGRLHIGDEQQSLGEPREVVTEGRGEKGWVFFDVTLFGARAINERRNSISFELSLPCQRPADNVVTVSLLNEEARLIVEYY